MPALFEEAMVEVKDALRASITRVDVVQDEFDDFTDRFAADFAYVVGGEKGPVVWRRDRQNMVNLGRYIGTIAEMYAMTEVPQKETVGMEELVAALKIVQPRCRLPLPDGSRQQRFCYCKGVSL